MYDLPVPLAQAIEKALAGFSGAEIDATVEDLRRAYRAPGSIQGHPLDTDLAAATYAAYRMPGTYAATRASLAQLTATGAPSPGSVLDLGGGTGAAAWAVASTWAQVERLTVLDPSPEVVAMGRRLATAGPPALTSARWVVGVAGSALPEVEAVVASYLLGELPPTERPALIGRLIATSRMAVFVEPGTPAGHSRILKVRQIMIEAGWHVAAPCPHDAACPLQNGDWCHFRARFPRTSRLRKLKDASLGHDDEKFSFVAATADAVHPAAGRVVRQPTTRPGMVSLQVCAADGDLRPAVIPRSQRALYRQARKARWGSEWPP